MKYIIKYFTLFGLCIFCSCVSSFQSESELLSYINDTHSGLVKEKVLEGMTFRMQYFPNEYAVFNSVSGEKYTQPDIETAVKEKENSITFVMTISLDRGHLDNALFKGITEFKDYKQRIDDLQFQFDNYVKLESGNKVLRPKLTLMEETYNVGDQRKLVIVFSEPELDQILAANSTFSISYDDEIFNTGTATFRFESEDVKNIPNINFWTYQPQS